MLIPGGNNWHHRSEWMKYRLCPVTSIYKNYKFVMNVCTCAAVMLPYDVLSIFIALFIRIYSHTVQVFSTYSAGHMLHRGPSFLNEAKLTYSFISFVSHLSYSRYIQSTYMPGSEEKKSSPTSACILSFTKPCSAFLSFPPAGNTVPKYTGIYSSSKSSFMPIPNKSATMPHPGFYPA